jgi:predicted Zn-dependent peptidase
VVENHEVPLVDIQLVFKAGDVFDENLATMTAEMLMEGTAGRRGLSKAEIDERIESVGASLRAGSDRFSSTLSTRVMKPDMGMALDLIAEVASNPKMDEDALAKLRDAAKVNLRNAKSSGQSLGARLLGQIMYPEGHPYGRPFANDEMIDSITVDQLKSFHSSYYVPNNAFLMLSGDVTVDEAKGLVEKELGALKPAESFPDHPLQKFKAEDYQKAKPAGLEVHIIDRKSISTEIFVGNLSLARNHADWIKWTVTNKILGSGAASRLFQDVRETRKLTYGIGSRVIGAKAVGAFVIGTQTKKVDEMMDAIFEHIDRIRTEAPTEKEFLNAQTNLAQSFPLRVETAGQVASQVETQLTYGLADDYFSTYRDEVLKVQIEDVQRTAAKWIDPNPVIVMVGRKSKITKAIARVDRLKDAKVVIYDTDLQVIDGGGKSPKK